MAGKFDKYLDEQVSGGNRFAKYASQGPSREQAFFSGAADALTFGFGDELQGVFGGQDAIDAARNRQDMARATHPVSFGAGQIGGTVAGGLATGGLGAAATGGRALTLAARLGPMSRMALAGAAGAAGGGLYGAGSSYGDAGERTMAGLEAAPWGAATGVFGQGVGEVLGRVGQGIARSVSPEMRASKMVADSIGRFGGDEASIRAAAAELGPLGGTAMDVIPGGVQLAKGAGVRPSAEREAFRQMLDARNNQFGAQTAEDAWQAVNGTGRGSVAEEVAALTKDQRTRAAPIYKEVDARTVTAVPQQLDTLMANNPRLFGPARASALESVRRVTGDASEEAARRQPLYWRRLLENTRAEADAGRRAAAVDPLGAPKGSRVAEIAQDYRAARVMIGRMLGPRFREAQHIYADDAAMKDAIERGYEAVTKRANDLDLGELSQWMAGATRGEVQAARRSALTRLSDMLDNADTMTGRRDVLRELRASKGQERVLQRLFGSNLDTVLARADKRRQLFQNSVEAGIGVNSHTADRLAARESQMMQTMPLTGGGWREQIVRLLTGDATDKYDEAVSNQLLKMLSTPASELASGPGVGAWANRTGLLSRAAREAADQRQFRTRAALGALSTGLYAPIGGETLLGYSGYR